MNQSKKDTAVVVFSGGQDSTTTLLAAEVKHDEVLAIHFIYGQRHSAETTAAVTICSKLGIKMKIVDVSFMSTLVSSALLQKGDISARHKDNAELPASFVPGRNALFLTIAHAYAQEVGADSIYTGVCETDYSGYPDCRQMFIDALQCALNVGYEKNIGIITPLMRLTKAETFALADKLGALPFVLAHTLTCYENGHEQVNAWGKGCGQCPACLLRAKGFAEFKATKEER